MSKVTRHFDAKAMNAILNHPAVRPDVAVVQGTVLDISNVIANQNHIVLCGEFGGCVFIKSQPGTYEVHTQAVPEGRGAWIAAAAKDCVDWMFTHTDAFEITTRIPADHAGARRLAMNTGMRHEFTRENECEWRGKLQNVDIFSFRIQDWASRTTAFDEKGREFHDFLHAEAERLGVTTPAHPDDPQHNRYVGICMAMLDAGQTAKAVNFYNRWAFLCRHPQIRLIGINPITIQFDLGNLIFENGTKRVELMDKAA